MAEPVFIDLPEGAWTKIAEATTTGVVSKKTEAPQEYLQTYRTAGGTPPPNTEAGKEEGVPMFQDLRASEEISSSSPIDVYIFPVGAAGRVRVDV